MNPVEEEEEPDECSVEAEALALRRRRHSRAMYLVCVALLGLQRENVDNKIACPVAGVVLIREVWLGSTFRASRNSLPPWKKLIDEYLRLLHELTPREKAQEEVDGELVLMEAPMRTPIEGENALWGPDRNIAPPECFGWDRTDDSRLEISRRLPRTFPHVPDPFQSESESDGARHLERHAFGTAEASQVGVIDDEDWDRDE